MHCAHKREGRAKRVQSDPSPTVPSSVYIPYPDGGAFMQELKIKIKLLTQEHFAERVGGVNNTVHCSVSSITHTV